MDRSSISSIISNSRMHESLLQTGLHVTLALREELTEGSTTFETPTAWVRLRQKEWQNDTKMAEEQLAKHELAAVGGSALSIEGRRAMKGLRALVKRTKEISDRYATLADTYWVLHRSAMNCDKRGWQPLTFKSSSKKGDKELAFVPTNMHVQLFSISRHQNWAEASLASSHPHDYTTEVHDFVTVGLSAAHAMGFDENG